MTRRSVFRLAAVLTVLAFLLPLAALADSCVDCLWASTHDCCPPACCSCCVHGLSVVATPRWGDPRPATASTAPEPREDRFLSFHSRDVFHVPKPALV